MSTFKLLSGTKYGISTTKRNRSIAYGVCSTYNEFWIATNIFVFFQFSNNIDTSVLGNPHIHKLRPKLPPIHSTHAANKQINI